jgi:hypothetical protein
MYTLVDSEYIDNTFVIKKYKDSDNIVLYTLSGLNNIYSLDDEQVTRNQLFINTDESQYSRILEHSFKFDILKTVHKIFMAHKSNTHSYAMDYLHNQLYRLDCDYNVTVTLHACLFILLNNFFTGDNFYKIVDYNT